MSTLADAATATALAFFFSLTVVAVRLLALTALELYTGTATRSAEDTRACDYFDLI